jgi:GPR1/FUN34/yaaH family
MAVLGEERRGATLVELSPAADPAPLGLAAFALTTFMLSGHNASFIPDVLWVGLALFYGGLIQLLAGMWEFRNRNVFGSTAFSTYGGFWLGLGGFVVLSEATKLGRHAQACRRQQRAGLVCPCFRHFQQLHAAVVAARQHRRVRRLPRAAGHGDPARDRLLQGRPRHEPVVPARRGLGRDRDRRDRVVCVGRGRDQRHVVLAGVAGRAASLGPPALARQGGFSSAEAPGSLGWRA